MARILARPRRERSWQALELLTELHAVSEPVPVVEDRLRVQRSPSGQRPQIGRRQMPGDDAHGRAQRDDGEVVRVHAGAVRHHDLDPHVVRRAVAGTHPGAD